MKFLTAQEWFKPVLWLGVIKKFFRVTRFQTGAQLLYENMQ